MFKRKAYDELLEWKRNLAGRYAALLEGPRRVGKSTIVEAFAEAEYESHITIDFANITRDMLDVFGDIADLDMFFLRLQAQTGVVLVPGRSVIVFDEVQLAPMARQAIKYLVADGRYNYIETGSLVSIRKNVKDIVIPSEEHRIAVYPMDYEEFCWARGKDTCNLLRQVAASGKPVGNATNRALMRDFRLYMAVGGMPQAVDAYVSGESLQAVDFVKREIIELYKADFRKIDSSGRTSALFEAIPAQLASKSNRFRISSAIGKRPTGKDAERLFDLVDSRAVLACYNVTDPGPAMKASRDLGAYKLYMADTGLFTTMMLDSGDVGPSDKLYAKLLGDDLPANLGFLYENAVAQVLASMGRDLLYHTWTPEGKTHNREVDFLVADGAKVAVLEVKSSNINNHKSINEFAEKYSHIVSRRLLLSQKDSSRDGQLEMRPLYLAPAIFEAMQK